MLVEGGIHYTRMGCGSTFACSKGWIRLEGLHQDKLFPPTVLIQWNRFCREKCMDPLKLCQTDSCLPCEYPTVRLLFIGSPLAHRTTCNQSGTLSYMSLCHVQHDHIASCLDQIPPPPHPTNRINLIFFGPSLVAREMKIS